MYKILSKRPDIPAPTLSTVKMASMDILNVTITSENDIENIKLRHKVLPILHLKSN